MLQDLSPNHERQFDDFMQSDMFQYYARPHMPSPDSFMSYLNQTGVVLTTPLNEVKATDNFLNIPDRVNQPINKKSALRLFKCTTCGKDFKQKVALQQHERIHTDSRPYGCSECGKTFRQQSHLDQHLRIHSNEKPFACTVCFRTFRQRAILNQHLLIHSGERPYFCMQPGCGKQFRQKSNLDQHIHTHQGESTQLSDSPAHHSNIVRVKTGFSHFLFMPIIIVLTLECHLPMIFADYFSSYKKCCIHAVKTTKK